MNIDLYSESISRNVILARNLFPKIIFSEKEHEVNEFAFKRCRYGLTVFQIPQSSISCKVSLVRYTKELL